MAFVRAAVALATIAGTITAVILLLALRSAADVAVFSPVSRFFALVWGLLLLGIFASIPWIPFWCTLFCSVCLFSASLSPTIASLLCFGWAPHLWWSLFLCVGFLSVPAELCLLPLLLLGVGWALAEPLLVWLLCLWSWGTCGFPLSVLQWLPFSGSAPG